MRIQSLETEMARHESVFKDIQRAKYSGNFRAHPGLKRFIPVHHVAFLDFKDAVEALATTVNSRNHTKKKLNSIIARAERLNAQWNIELRHYFI